MNIIEFEKRIANIDLEKLLNDKNKLIADILTMTTISASGHPGGSISSLQLLMAIYSVANINRENCNKLCRDKVIISHGHISPAVYSVLAYNGIIDRDDILSTFRKAGSLYEGHIERVVDGVEWTTGNLGQGLSVASGVAIADRLNCIDSDIYVLMGDGEQEKGQINEARRLIKKYNLTNITTIVDYNNLQISGKVSDIMPSLDIAKSFEADGFDIITIDGHNFQAIFDALLKAKKSPNPVLIIAKTIMGKGVSFMEDKNKFHGSTLSYDDYKKALIELNQKDEFEYYKSKRLSFTPNLIDATKHSPINLSLTSRTVYDKDIKTDNRSAFGSALLNIIKENYDRNESTKVAVFDCDLASSVKTDKVAETFPDRFFQCGISEHNTAVLAGASSVYDIISVFADFGMFGVDEVYNQQRLNGINESNIKVITTHVGTDVGEDGKTHQCIDYLSLMRNIFGFEVIAPADPNQTDATIFYAMSIYKNIHIAMGRSKIDIICKEDGDIFFGKDYNYIYGKVDIIREGRYPIFSYGTFLHRAIKVHDELKKVGVDTAVINVSSPLYINDDITKYLESGLGFVYEDHIPSGGLFSTLSMMIAENGYKCKLTPFGIDRFAPSGTPDEILKILKLDELTVADKIKSIVKS